MVGNCKPTVGLSTSPALELKLIQKYIKVKYIQILHLHISN